MRVLITGALGHIGSALIRSFRPGDYQQVVLLDNLSTERYCSLFNLPDGVPFRFVEEDVCTADVGKYLAGIDVVIHLAAITNAEASFEIREQVQRVNVEGTERVARASAAAGCKLVFVSTTSVYGTQQEIVDENCGVSELRPQSPYAESKLRAESLLQSLAEQDGLRFVICRFGTICGPSIGMRFHTAINRFVWQACLRQPITVWRTAWNQKRPYLVLDDAIRALRFILETDVFDNQIYNVLTTNATVGEIVNMIRTYVPTVELKEVDSPVMNQLSYIVACEKFKALGFRFEGRLEQGIGETFGLIKAAAQATVEGGVW